jgi:arginyl-tRNA synthetase
MIRSRLKNVLDGCFRQGVTEGAWSGAGEGRYALELPKHEGQGDFSTNMALVLAGIEKGKPRQLAAKIVELLARRAISSIAWRVAGQPSMSSSRRDLGGVIRRSSGRQRLRLQLRQRQKVMVGSSAPTPRPAEHRRPSGHLGDPSPSPEATGHDVFREYYYNDAGRQMRVLGESTRADISNSSDWRHLSGTATRATIFSNRPLAHRRGRRFPEDHADVTPFKERPATPLQVSRHWTE